MMQNPFLWILLPTGFAPPSHQISDTHPEPIYLKGIFMLDGISKIMGQHSQHVSNMDILARPLPRVCYFPIWHRVFRQGLGSSDKNKKTPHTTSLAHSIVKNWAWGTCLLLLVNCNTVHGGRLNTVVPGCCPIP